MAYYQNSAAPVDAKIEIGNFTISVGAENATAGSSWTNLGAGMVKSFVYETTPFTSQAGNATDPIEGVSRETAKVDIDLIEYDGSSWSALSGGLITGTSGSLIVGGNTMIQTMKALKLVNVRKLATGSSQTTTYVLPRIHVETGFTMTPKSDNDTDPVNVYSFSITANQASGTSAGVLFTKTVA